jgi:hypothetical protein
MPTKRLFVMFLLFSTSASSQCTVESASKIPFVNTQTNSYKYIGTNGKENKANTEIMYTKMLEIHKLFDDAFKNSTGMVGKWRAQVDNQNNEGLVKGVIEISMQTVTCKDNGEYNKSTGNPTFEIEVFVNGFEPWIIRDEKKAAGFTAANKKDSLNGHLLYLIAEKQVEEPFKGFPLYYSGWNRRPEQSVVIITKPNVPLFKPVTIGEFVGLLRNWNAGYNPEKPGNPRELTASKIDKFINENTGEFFARPCITLWDRENQIVYIRKSTFVDAPTQGNPWVIFNPDYIEKNAAATSLQFISIEWHLGDDAVSQKAFNDFKNNFDFKRLQAMLGR